MRVLLVNHLPLWAPGGGQQTAELATGLAALGHEVRAVVADRTAAGDPLPVRRLICRAGDATTDCPFEFPVATRELAGHPAFAELNAQQLAEYREQFRRRIDAEVEQFNPDVIHALHVWIEGHLALETGVPYVLSAVGPELTAAGESASLHALAQQAAENGGRIVVASEPLRRQVAALFEGVAERVEVAPRSDFLRMSAIYQEVVAARHGI